MIRRRKCQSNGKVALAAAAVVLGTLSTSGAQTTVIGDKTLVAWDDNFTANWPKPQTGEDERFYRMWRYYLLCCAGGFRSRIIHVWQLVLSKTGVPEGYVTQR